MPDPLSEDPASPDADPIPTDLDALLWQACHDLRTPLTAAAGHAQLLRRRLRHTALTDDHASFERGLAAIDVALAEIAKVANRLDPSRR